MCIAGEKGAAAGGRGRGSGDCPLGTKAPKATVRTSNNVVRTGSIKKPAKASASYNVKVDGKFNDRLHECDEKDFLAERARRGVDVLPPGWTSPFLLTGMCGQRCDKQECGWKAMEDEEESQA